MRLLFAIPKFELVHAAQEPTFRRDFIHFGILRHSASVPARIAYFCSGRRTWTDFGDEPCQITVAGPRFRRGHLGGPVDFEHTRAGINAAVLRCICHRSRYSISIPSRTTRARGATTPASFLSAVRDRASRTTSTASTGTIAAKQYVGIDPLAQRVVNRGGRRQHDCHRVRGGSDEFPDCREARFAHEAVRPVDLQPPRRLVGAEAEFRVGVRVRISRSWRKAFCARFAAEPRPALCCPRWP